jgi:hypothetical protein
MRQMRSLGIDYSRLNRARSAVAPKRMAAKFLVVMMNGNARNCLSLQTKFSMRERALHSKLLLESDALDGAGLFGR